MYEKNSRIQLDRLQKKFAKELKNKTNFGQIAGI